MQNSNFALIDIELGEDDHSLLGLQIINSVEKGKFVKKFSGLTSGKKCKTKKQHKK